MKTGREAGSSAELMARIAKGWQPNRYLTNMSMAFFANAGEYVATSIFPICPVELSTGYYYIYNKGDLARTMCRENRSSARLLLRRWATRTNHTAVR